MKKTGGLIFGKQKTKKKTFSDLRNEPSFSKEKVYDDKNIEEKLGFESITFIEKLNNSTNLTSFFSRKFGKFGGFL